MNKTVKYFSLCLLLLALGVSCLAGCATSQQEGSEPTTTAPNGTSGTTDATDESTGTTETTEPTEPDTEPTEPGTEPTQPGTEPTEPSTTPTEPGTQPTEPSTRPTEPAETQEPTTPPATTQPGPAEGEEGKPAKLVIGSNTAKPTGKGGYYFTYTATKDATLLLQLPETGWTYQVTNQTSGIADSMRTSADEMSANPAQISVLKGDKIQIVVNTLSGKAGTISITAELGDAMGTQENPIRVHVGNENQIRVPAGKTVYFTERAQNTIMTVTNATGAVVEFMGNTYSSQNGSIQITMPKSKGGNAELLSIAITNQSAAEQMYCVSFALPVGTTDNPAALTLGKNTAHVEADSQFGYVYIWTASSTGTFTLKMEGTKWSYQVYNLNSYVVESSASNESSSNATASVEVKAGDVLQISINTETDNKGKSPAGDVTFTASFK